MGILNEIKAEICLDYNNIEFDGSTYKLNSDPNVVDDVKTVWGIDLTNQNLLKHIKNRGLFLIKTNGKAATLYGSCTTDEQLDAEEQQELLAAKAAMAIAEAKLGDKSKYANIPDIGVNYGNSGNDRS